MKIKEFIESRSMTLKEFCRRNKFNYPYFRQISSGIHKPSPKLALRIEQATGGKVDRLELLYPNAKN